MARIQPFYEPPNYTSDNPFTATLEAFLGTRSKVNAKVLEQHFARMDPVLRMKQMEILRENIMELQKEKARNARELLATKGDISVNLVSAMGNTQSAYIQAVGSEAVAGKGLLGDILGIEERDRARVIEAQTLDSDQRGAIMEASRDSKRQLTTPDQEYLEGLNAALATARSPAQRQWIVIEAMQQAARDMEATSDPAMKDQYLDAIRAMGGKIGVSPHSSDPIGEARADFENNYGLISDEARAERRKAATTSHVPRPDFDSIFQAIGGMSAPPSPAPATGAGATGAGATGTGAPGPQSTLPEWLAPATGAGVPQAGAPAQATPEGEQPRQVNQGDPFSLSALDQLANATGQDIDRMLAQARAELAELQALDAKQAEVQWGRAAPPLAVNWLAQSPFANSGHRDQRIIDAIARTPRDTANEARDAVGIAGISGASGWLQSHGGAAQPPGSVNYDDLSPSHRGQGLYAYIAAQLERAAGETDPVKQQTIRDQILALTAALPDDPRHYANSTFWQGFNDAPDYAALAQQARAISEAGDIHAAEMIADQLDSALEVRDPYQKVAAIQAVIEWSQTLPTDLTGSLPRSIEKAAEQYIQNRDGAGLVASMGKARDGLYGVADHPALARRITPTDEALVHRDTVATAAGLDTGSGAGGNIPAQRPSTMGNTTGDTDKERAKHHYLKGLEAAAAGRQREALGHFLTVDQLFPRAATAHNIAKVYEEIGNPAEARRYYLEALKRNPQQEESRTALGELYLNNPTIEIDSKPKDYTQLVEMDDATLHGRPLSMEEVTAPDGANVGTDLLAKAAALQQQIAQLDANFDALGSTNDDDNDAARVAIVAQRDALDLQLKRLQPTIQQIEADRRAGLTADQSLMAPADQPDGPGVQAILNTPDADIDQIIRDNARW